MLDKTIIVLKTNSSHGIRIHKFAGMRCNDIKT